jgi:hypothetical protein
MFSVTSVPRYYKHDRRCNELVLGQSPGGENMSTEAEDIVGIRHEATTGEGIGDWEDLVRAVVNSTVCELPLSIF